MNWLKYIAIIILPVFLISSTGVVVYEHHCSQSGTFKGFYSEVVHDCNKKEVVIHCESEKTSCCKSVEIPDNIPVAEKECCTTDVSIYQIDSDYTKTSSTLLFPQLFASVDTKNYDDRNVFIQSEEIVRGPPDKVISSSARRSILQVYII